MGFWRALFGSKEEVAPPPAREGRDSGFGRDFITLPSHDFYGVASCSPNGRYTIAWLDGGPDQSRRGRWLFLDGDTVVAKGNMARPNDGKVADNGVFILNDWGGIETLSGTLKAFGPDGTSIFRRKFKANLFNNGLSRDGRWAVCQTCNSDNEDAGKLFVLNLAQGIELCSWAPESGWANSYTFAPDGQTLTLTYAQGSAFRYSINGEFLDRTLWLSTGLQRGDLNIVRRLLDEAGDQPSPELIQLLLPAIDAGMKTIHPMQDRVRAFALKMRGQCYEAIAEPSKALEAYTEALQLDPKVGVKRRTDRLRKVVPS